MDSWINGWLDYCLPESREVKNPPFHPSNLPSGRLFLLLVAGDGRKQELLTDSLVPSILSSIHCAFLQNPPRISSCVVFWQNNSKATAIKEIILSLIILSNPLPRSRFGGTLFEQNIKNVMREMTFAFEVGSNKMPYQWIQLGRFTRQFLMWLCAELKIEVL